MIVGVDADGENRRRLPSWMLGVTAADQMRKSKNEDRISHHQEEEVASHAYHSKAKAASRQHEKESSTANSGLPSKCETKRKKRLSSREDVKLQNSIPETFTGNKKSNAVKRKVLESSPKRQKVKTASFKIAEEREISSHSYDDAELTVGDLLIIAEEYVKTDKDEALQPSNGESESERQLPTTDSSRNESGGSLVAPNRNQRTPALETTDSYNSPSISASEQTHFTSIMTGDPAQDMLDLFLGPLLKKSVVKEKGTEYTTKDMAFDFEIPKQSQNAIVGEEMVPHTKKKGSLKDKVAMLLD
ncbi:hypothetical protein CFOL_v3_30692 [Cephalotus follicularis]|uniref:Uncharacterized protein n=1 Tax=Cephalotus follicularis TaxID=3775 RepID=A0A1Q3D433_CEPFO|nr:hypothetical protein CFOL_v3_30692 [Cephalotus follicularis]